MKILIIEDEDSIRAVLQEILEINGHEVTPAANGAEGLKTAAVCRPEIILCDINMPFMNGYQVLEGLQKLPELREVPFVFLTAEADRASHRRGMELGASDFITKPFTEREITGVLAAITRRQQPLRERVEKLVTRHSREVGADWSHELMTPLNGVLGGLALLEAEADTIKPDTLRELLSIVRTGAERQLALSTKLVRFYELERIKTRPPSPHAHCDAAEHLAHAANLAAQSVRRLDDLALRAGPGIAAIDATHFHAAVTELVANALFFSKPGQPVTVTGAQRGDRYVVEIEDRGVGMTPAECAAVDAFVQFSRERHNQQGLGLGLAIARSAAEIAGGRLAIRPAASGQGLLATLDLPCGS